VLYLWLLVHLIMELSNFYYTRRILVWFLHFCNGFVFTTDKGIFLTSYHVTFLRHICTCNTAQFTFLEPESISATGFVQSVIFYLQLKLHQPFHTSIFVQRFRIQYWTMIVFYQKFDNINEIILKAGWKGCK